jgi:hypothetical protein
MSLFDRWFGRTANAIQIGTAVPAGGIAVLSAYLSTTSEWMEQFGGFGLLMAGLAGGLLTMAFLALWTRTRIWMYEAKLRKRSVGGSSPFDPMATTYENKRLYLKDLAPAGRRQVLAKRFINCEIIGPGNVVLGVRSSDHKPWPSVQNNIFQGDCDIIEIDPTKVSQNGIYFFDCSFDGCQFFTLNLLFFGRSREDWNWITPKAASPEPEDNQ